MKKIFLVILIMSLIRIAMAIICPVFITGVYAQNQTLTKNEFFKSKIQSSTWDFNENVSRLERNSDCPMCGGGSSFGGGVCNSCNYLSGSALGSYGDNSVPIDMSSCVFLLCSVFYIIIILLRENYNKRDSQ